MTAQEFIQKWHNSINHLGLPTVGIHVGWDIIPHDSKVENFNGERAWEKLYACTPPWFKTPKTFNQLVTKKDSDYQQIVGEETNNGKIEYYRRNGLQEPFFCAFSNPEESFVILGDGNHRFMDSLYLIHDESCDFSGYFPNTLLDIIYLKNFDDVMLPQNIWHNQYHG